MSVHSARPDDDCDTSAEGKIIEKLNVVNPFADLPEKIIAMIAQNSDFRECIEEETVLASGEYDGTLFYVVCEGGLKVSQLNEVTGEMQIVTYRKGQSFGLAAAVCGRIEDLNSQITLSAGGAGTEIIIIESERFREIVLQRPTLSRVLMQYFAESIVDQEVGVPREIESAATRVFEQLLKIIERDNVSEVWRISKMPKHRELAELAGVEESEAAAAIAEIIQAGVVKREYPGLIIEDISKLNQLAN